MENSAENVINHCLTIIHGITGEYFSMDRDDTSEGVAPTYVWHSHPMVIKSGIMLFVAKSVRIQISVPVDEDGIATVDCEDLRVQVAFIFTRHDGGEFSTMRVLNFKGPYFHPFI